MAGDGKRFKLAGYELPKPLIDVAGRSMIERVIDSLNPNVPTRWVFLVRNEEHELTLKLWDRVPGSYVIPCGATEGAACTCLLARHRCPDDEPLLIANCDQLVEGFVLQNIVVDGDAGVLTMERHDDPKWSYVMVEGDLITGVAEKRPISNRATCGLYWFRRAKDFFDAANEMIAACDRVNGEYYVAPTLNYMIRSGKVVREVRIEDYGGVFHGLGTPEDLETYLNRSK
jgi:NDP-sugar pyrophosphorylase family protein